VASKAREDWPRRRTEERNREAFFRAGSDQIDSGESKFESTEERSRWILGQWGFGTAAAAGDHLKQ